jgi:hypothetical protein
MVNEWELHQRMTNLEFIEITVIVFCLIRMFFYVRNASLDKRIRVSAAIILVVDLVFLRPIVPRLVTTAIHGALISVERHHLIVFSFVARGSFAIPGQGRFV